MIRFEGYERRIDKIEACMKEYGIESLEQAKQICTDKGVDVDAYSPSALKMPFGPIPWARQLPLKKA